MASRGSKKKERNEEKRNNILYTQSEEEKKLVAKIMDRYRASYIHKDSLGINNMMVKCEAYWSGEVNLPEDEDDPGSETNIVQPIIESQVADIVSGQIECLVKGVGPSDEPFAKDVGQIIKWIWRMNKMLPKLDEGERERLNYGTVGWKVFFDPDALKGRGLPTILPCGIDTLFPDPKIKDIRRIQEGDFFIQVLPFTLGQLRRMFGKRAELVKPEGNFKVHNPNLFKQDEFDNANEVINSQCLLYEYWEKDDDGNLRRIYMAGGIILEDSDWDHVSHDGARQSFYEHGKYPFVLIPCYKKKGRLWGMGDTEQLIPIQDLINDFDDQIRMNARLMGNVQIVVGLAAGINLKKWTNKAGLKIPAKDHTAWQTVNPPTIPAYIPLRRDTAFRESEIVSGRSDVVEGRRSGSLRAAAAILALQEAGSRRANHKKLMLQEGFVEVVELLLDYVKEFMDVEQAYDITENDKIDYLWFRGTKLKEIPWKTLNENFDPTSDDPRTSMYKDLTEEVENEETGEKEVKVMTKEAEFDLEFSIGAGMPNNKSFLYQAVVELNREGLITREEGRETLKKVLNWPVIDPFNPQGTFTSRNMSPEQLAAANGQPVPGEQPMPEQVPEGQDMGDDRTMVMQQAMALLQGLDPEALQELLYRLGGAA
jgi:hypothetical protein